MADSQQTNTLPETDAPSLPADVIPVVPMRNVVLFPGVVLPITVGREESIAAAQEAVRAGRKIAVLLQRDPSVEKPAAKDLYEIGVLATVVRYVTAPDGTHHLVAQGESRFRLKELVQSSPFLAARIETLADTEASGSQVEARLEVLKQRALEALALLPQVPAELPRTLQSIDSASQLSDLIVSFMDVKPAEKQELLETLSLKERLDKVLKLLAHRVEVLKITKDISEHTQEALGERQREAILREQLRQLQKELGESEDGSSDAQELEKAVAEAGMPAEVDEHARKELKRLRRMSEASPEYGMVRSYLDWMVALPWSKTDAEDIDIERARRVLDEDHYGLEKVKRRILEYLAVRKLNPQGRSPILCFVGPPGVGKTSLGQSIARALGLKFVRASLGGVHDEAEIRGHRRTYIGALPGNIVQGLRKAGTRNPVFMLDEIDKLNASYQGDPASAMLEVLDPEQNSTFRDNYIAQPFDLSRVLFIATANVLETIPGPLRDRMEIIELTGYTQEEKLQIAKRYLIQRQLKANERGAGDGYRRRPGSRDRRVHARVRLPEPRARDRRPDAQRGGANRGGQGGLRAHRCAGRPWHPGCGPVRERGGTAHFRAWRRHGIGLDAGGWGHSLRGVRAHAGQRQADSHRATGRCDEGERAGGAQPGEGAGERAGDRWGSVRSQRHPRACAGRGNP
jgi:ATP-dependent Lon protease